MTESLLDFIQNHSEYTVLLVFCVAFAESLAFVGLLVPGWLLLLAIGGLVGRDLVAFYPVAVSAYLGAVMGEWLSFYLGRRYHEPILATALARKHENWVRWSHDFFQRYGGWGIFIGRFFGPARAVLPFVAGVSEMDKRLFFWVNLSSGLLWSPLYLIPGILLGAAFELETHMAYQLIAVITMILLFLTYNLKKLKSYVGLVKVSGFEMKKNLSHRKILLEMVLASAISLMLLWLFVSSQYFELLLSILAVVGERL